ncbi:hypothetical protein OEA41_004593 [Lepraria neglecta]|uniref:Uncharacterized protein n=1 Tax=Lepraria neglecta TaxID=209136 RepID=A0AAE0DEN7_9LECA|nr:hypothetical protein OEA41_004593 [Lepraria neglecta]
MHEEQDSVEKISRTKVERQIMKQLDKATFPIDYKISWYSAILKGNDFKAFWLGVRSRLDLSHEAIKPYIPNKDLNQYDIPSECEDGSTDFTRPLNTNKRGVNTLLASPAVSTFTAAQQDDSDSSSSDDEIDEAAKTFAAQLSGPSTWDNPQVSAPEPPAYTPHPRDPREALGDHRGLDREEGDNGEWVGNRAKTTARSIAKAKAAKRKAKATPKPRTPAKPQGVTKSKAPTPAKPKGIAKPRAHAKPRTPAKANSQIPAKSTSPTPTAAELTPDNPSLITTLKMPTQAGKRSHCEMIADEARGTAVETLAGTAAKRLKKGEPISLSMQAAMIKRGHGGFEY